MISDHDKRALIDAGRFIENQFWKWEARHGRKLERQDIFKVAVEVLAVTNIDPKLREDVISLVGDVAALGEKYKHLFETSPGPGPTVAG